MFSNAQGGDLTATVKFPCFPLVSGNADAVERRFLFCVESSAPRADGIRAHG